MKFNPQEWKEKSHQNFEGTWHEGPSVVTPPGEDKKYPRLRYTRAHAHPIFETINRLREIYLSMGFDEIENPVIVEENEIYRQFGPEAMAVLDRVFYVGGLPRPNVGIARAQLDAINAILKKPMPAPTEEKLRETLHAYKKSEIDGDELTHELAKVLDTDDGNVVHILDSVFPEFKSLAPESSRNTLRSHMTSGWFMTLGSIWEKTPLPIKLFSVDRCFRREQAEGPTRLMAYHSASCVVAGDDVTLEDGKAISEALLSAFGYEDFRFQPDEKRSKYYMPDSQTEVYAKHPVHGWVEVATFGMYSPSALGEYGVGIPVMNLGLGVERLAMIAYNATDIRQLSYPQFFPRQVSDRELARAVHLKAEPVTIEGKVIAQAIAAAGAANAAAQGPCSFEAYKGSLLGAQVTVTVEETEANAKLLGPACANEIFAHDGNILGVPDAEKWKDVRENGVHTGITYLAAASAFAAAEIEQAARCKKGTLVQVKMAKHPSDINLKIDDYAVRAITDNKKKIDVRGPVFVSVKSVIGE
ncbi:O-phosphoserine--tRNA ligase [Methanoregula sp. UBA64]|uniref:O-phosphoserine--tRNA ligase n=1 Tax=Methanoregula sp. UBA64 TaxID=1915554 RepID=UPI0025D24CE6|nr:O-phosphoserine--tRNA ligase [Methanoregula sp. UBA64]